MDRQSLAGFFDELDKIGQFGGDIDDLYAAPNSSILPTLKRVHNIGKMKGSSWADIGPVGQREGREIPYPRVPWEKRSAFTAEQKDAWPHRVEDREEPRPLLGRILTGKKTRKVPTAVPISAGEYRAYLDKGGDPREFFQKKAFKLQGHTDVQGLRIAIENRKGSVRKGTDSDGNEWRTKMIHPYGYLVGTKAKDGEPVDVYVGPDKEAPHAFVVHQHKVDGTGFDEDKVMLGFKTKKEAKEAYLKHYDDPKFLGPISKLSVERLRDLVRSKQKLVKITG